MAMSRSILIDLEGWNALERGSGFLPTGLTGHCLPQSVPISMAHTSPVVPLKKVKE